MDVTWTDSFLLQRRRSFRDSRTDPLATPSRLTTLRPSRPSLHDRKGTAYLSRGRNAWPKINFIYTYLAGAPMAPSVCSVSAGTH
ncbi:hypothetical protein KM043_013566 [Ampulex compressa]|nr:hypothetical protein KM043_013566 [Ampulex compressa]